MKVILLELVAKLGEQGTVLVVKDGYARNYLIPNGLALPATASNLRVFEQQQVGRAKRLAAAKAEASKLAEILANVTTTMSARAGEGRLYGSVGASDIAQALLEQHQIQIDRRRLGLKRPIRELGSYDIPYRAHPEVLALVKVQVVPQA
ncbi:MAG: 50S ribosomal protein L9 [Deinococcus sp.]|nr:50S ribosomal protein L9 [Deinococcus sp.]